MKELSYHTKKKLWLINALKKHNINSQLGGLTCPNLTCDML